MLPNLVYQCHPKVKKLLNNGYLSGILTSKRHSKKLFSKKLKNPFGKKGSIQNVTYLFDRCNNFRFIQYVWLFFVIVSTLFCYNYNMYFQVFIEFLGLKILNFTLWFK